MATINYSRIRDAFIRHMAEVAAQQADENIPRSWVNTGTETRGFQDTEEEDYRFI